MAVDEKQKAAIKRYEAKHDRITIMFDKGIRQRIEDLQLGCTSSRFIMFATEFMLNYCENREKEKHGNI